MRTTPFMIFFLSFLFTACQYAPEKAAGTVVLSIGYSPQYEEEGVSIRSLAVLSDQLVWASANQGRWFRTTDGGKHWQSGTVPGAEERDFRCMHAFSAEKALVLSVASPAEVYLTEDGGEHWSLVYRNETEGIFMNSLFFTDEQTGYAVGDPLEGRFAFWKTTDGGQSWQNQFPTREPLSGEAHFAASNTCLTARGDKVWFVTGGKASRVHYSTDGAQSWQVVDAPVVQGSASEGLYSLCMINSLDGVAVGGSYTEPEAGGNTAIYTRDGGKSWLPAESMPAAYRSCVIALGTDSEYLLAVGKTGIDLSADQGRNWSLLDTTGFYTVRAVPEKNTGWLAGNGGRLVKFTLKTQ